MLATVMSSRENGLETLLLYSMLRLTPFQGNYA